MVREEALQVCAVLPSLPSASGAGCPAFVAYKLFSRTNHFKREGKLVNVFANSVTT